MNELDEPLSMRFIHKPARSQALVEKHMDDWHTRMNSDKNWFEAGGTGIASPEIGSKGVNHTQDDSENYKVLVEADTRLEQPAKATGTHIRPSSITLPKNELSLDNVEDNESTKSLNLLSKHSDSTEDIITYKLVRKKSGEIVKSSLKDSAYFDHKCSKSLPTTPSFKQVHFGDAFDVKYFKKKDKPNAISASNSPTVQSPEFSSLDDVFYNNPSHEHYRYPNDDVLDSDLYNSDDSFDSESESEHDAQFDTNYSYKYRNFGRQGDRDDDDDETDHMSFKSSKGSTAYPNPKHGKLIDWKLTLKNFPALNYDGHISRNTPVFLERVFITPDKKYLLGHIAVKNLSFEKSITLKYTFDNWLTIVEISTSYVLDIPLVLKKNNYDRFIFKIPLNSLLNKFNLHSSSSYGGSYFSSKNRFNGMLASDQGNHRHDNDYQFCIKYVANNQEFWDNNNFQNYEINLVKIINNAKGNEGESKLVNSKANGKPHGGLKGNSKQDSPHKSSGHIKPRYSSSYLRRRSSDSNLHSSLERDADYVKNNFYLSSPLLSNYNAGNFNSDNFDSDTLNSDNLNSSSISVADSNLSNITSPDAYESSSSVNGIPSRDASASYPDSSNNLDLKSLNSNLYRDSLSSKSYKELIDSYCFFNSNNTSNTKSKASSKPSDNKDVSTESTPPNEEAFQTNDLKASTDSNSNLGSLLSDANSTDTFTVSSMLGT